MGLGVGGRTFWFVLSFPFFLPLLVKSALVSLDGFRSKVWSFCGDALNPIRNSPVDFLSSSYRPQDIEYQWNPIQLTLIYCQQCQVPTMNTNKPRNTANINDSDICLCRATMNKTPKYI